jgi:predicted PurR-regulated permease PerM
LSENDIFIEKPTMPEYTYKQQKNIVLILLIILGLFLAYSLKNIFTALLGAAVLYTIFRPWYLHMIARKKWRRSLAAVCIILFSFIIIILPFFTLSWMVINKLSYYTSHPEEIREIISHLTGLMGREFSNPKVIEEALQNIQRWALGAFPSVLGAIGGIFLLISIMYFILYFMLVEYEKFEATTIAYLPFREKNVMIFAEEFKNMTYSNVLGQGIIALVQGTLVTVGFLIFGFKDSLFWGVVSMILSFVPVVGSALVFVPAGIIAISYQNIFGGIGIILWGAIIVANSDNVLRFIINKRIADTHPLITIIGVIIGIPMFGIMGLVFGPLLISYFILLVSLYESKYGNTSPQEHNVTDIKKKLIRKNDPK